MELRGYDLRYLITSLVLDHGATTTALLRTRLVTLGVGQIPRGTRDRNRRRARELEAALAEGLTYPPLPRYHPLRSHPPRPHPVNGGRSPEDRTT